MTQKDDFVYLIAQTLQLDILGPTKKKPCLFYMSRLKLVKHETNSCLASETRDDVSQGFSGGQGGQDL